MKFALLILSVVIFASAPRLQAEAIINVPLPERVISLCKSATLTPEDITYLKSMLAAGGPGECLSQVILYRHSPAEFEAAFRSYFGVDRSKPSSVLPNEEINNRVNAVIKEYKGRHPAEVASRVYLALRKKGFVAKGSDGEEISLEVMFRASVFAVVTGGSEERILKLAAAADGK